MQKFYRMYSYFRRLSWKIRLFVVLITFAVPESLVAYLTTRHTDGFGSLLIFSGILAALFFPWKRALALEWGLLLVYLIIDVAIEGPVKDQVMAFFMGTFMDLFIVGTVGILRNGWELSEQAQKQFEKLAELKDQFILNVNHELRTPLTTMVGVLDVLGDPDIDESDRGMFLDHARHAATELRRLSENILDALRTESDVSRSWIRNIDLDYSILEVIRHIYTDQHPIHLDIGEKIFVRGDADQLGQVICNLVSNSLKYSSRESPIFIRASKNDLYGIVAITDQGPGIAPEHIPLLFQKFSRIKSDLAGPVRGIGLGLYICRRFIEQMNGQIWVESILGKGSTFYVTLPLADLEKDTVPIPIIPFPKQRISA